MRRVIFITGFLVFSLILSLPAFAAPVTEETGGALSAGTPVQGEPFKDHIFATPAEYTRITGNRITAYGESPVLAALVSEGKLPPVEERLPEEPLVIRPLDEIGQYGGVLRDWANPSDNVSKVTDRTRRRLFLWSPDATRFYPSVIKGWEQSADNRTFTLFFRPGMKWSDGDDFDVDDFVFWWDDVQNNKDITPELSPLFRPGDEPMQLTVIDRSTVRYTFSVPVQNVAEKWWSSRPWAARHYLEQYHIKYNKDADSLAKQEGFDSWWQAFRFHGVWTTRHKYFARDPVAPVVHPWPLKEIGADAVVWERNPYYHVVDTAGNQLPYIDEIRAPVVQNPSELVPLRAMAGEIDFSSRQLSFGDFPIYKRNEASGGYTTYLLEDDDTSFALGFALNYTHKDPVLRNIFNDLRFRQALSLAINRDDISKTLFLEQARPFNSPVRPQWPGYEEWMGTYFAEFDVDKANRLLDEMGLKWDANRQWRQRPDGKVLQIIGEYIVGLRPYAESLLDIVRGHWAQVGVRLEPRPLQDKLWLERALANELDVGIWTSDGGSVLKARNRYPSRLMPPYHWIECCAMAALPWRQWLDSGGAKGVEPPEDVKRAYEAGMEWLSEPMGTARYEQLANEMIKLNVENLRFIGTVTAPPAVAIVNNRLGNIRVEQGWVKGLIDTHGYLVETWYIKE